MMYVGIEINSRPTNNSTRFDATETSISPATISSSEPRYSGMAPVASGRQAMSTITAPTANANQRPKEDSGSASDGTYSSRYWRDVRRSTIVMVRRMAAVEHDSRQRDSRHVAAHCRRTPTRQRPTTRSPSKANGAQALCEVEKRSAHVDHERRGDEHDFGGQKCDDFKGHGQSPQAIDRMPAAPPPTAEAGAGGLSIGRLHGRAVNCSMLGAMRSRKNFGCTPIQTITTHKGTSAAISRELQVGIAASCFRSFSGPKKTRFTSDSMYHAPSTTPLTASTEMTR